MCVKLCTLIKGQLLNALQEVTSRFGGQVTLSQARQEGNLTDSPETPPAKLFDDLLLEAAACGVDYEAEDGGGEQKTAAPLATCETELPPEQEIALPNGHVEKPKVSGEGTEIFLLFDHAYEVLVNFFGRLPPNFFLKFF